MNSKWKAKTLTLAVLSLGILFQPIAFAYDPFEFPGKGSKAKFSEALSIYAEGVDLVKAGRNKDAILQYKRAINLYPFSGTFHYNLGKAYSREKSYANAIACYKEAIKLAPDLDRAYTNLSEMFYRTKDYRSAEGFATKATQINPKDPAGFINLAQAETELKKSREAQKHLQIAQELPGGAEYLPDIKVIRSKIQSITRKTAEN
jgi:tetratricopeptide (TPR) repeat protein